MAIRVYEQGEELRSMAKAELDTVEIIRREIARKQEMLAELEARKTAIKIPTAEREAVKSSKSPEAAYVRIMELCEFRSEEINALNCELTERLIEIERRIDALDDAAERDVLFYRYVKGMGWEAVAQKTIYSTDHCRGFLHRNALTHYGLKYYA